MIEDFSFDIETGKFAPDSSSSVLSDLILILSTKSQGLSGYNGDWFLRPDFGNRSYELKVETDVVIRFKNCLEIALSVFKRDLRVHTIDINTFRRQGFKNRVFANIHVIETSGSVFNYEHFQEVV
jgi:hypothetical protein